jgi:hypothetical protein
MLQKVLQEFELNGRLYAETSDSVLNMIYRSIEVHLYKDVCIRAQTLNSWYGNGYSMHRRPRTLLILFQLLHVTLFVLSSNI